MNGIKVQTEMLMILNFNLYTSILPLFINVLKIEDVPLVEFMYLVFTHMPGESYCRRLRSLWYIYIFIYIYIYVCVCVCVCVY